MSFEEEFDRIIRQKAEGAKFPFSEQDWAKASNLIEKNRIPLASASSKKYYVYAAAGLVLAVLTTISYILTQDEKINQNQISQTLPTPASEETKQQLNPIQRSSEELTGPKKESSVIANLGNVVLQSKTQEKKQPEQKIILPSNKVIAPTTVSNGGGTTPKTPESIASAANDKEDQAIAVVENSKLKEKLLEELPEPVRQETEHNTSIDLLTAYSLPMDLNSGVTQEPNAEINFLKRYDEDYYHKNNKTHTYFLDAELGLSYVSGWNNEGTTYGKGWNGFGGINAGWFLTKRIALGVGLQAYSIQNINQIFYSTKQTLYTFGATACQTVMTSQSLLYAAVPVKVYYALNENHLFGLGVNAGYLIQAVSALNEYEFSEGVIQNESSEKVKGVYEGMNSVNLMLSASLLKRINQKFALQAELNYGLRDLFANNTTNDSKQSPSGIRIGLNYRICSK